MSEYEQNKKKVTEYRRRSKGNRIVMWLCNVMEWANEKLIKGAGQEGE